MAGRAFMLVSSLVLAMASLPVHAQERLAVIVSADRDAELSLEDVARVFLKQRRHWSRREPIVPVNRDADSDARRLFTERVFAAEARRLDSYWNRQYYQGILPPLTLASDEAVRRFVALEPNAIGYIFESWLDASVRAVLFLDPLDPPSP
jgi:ABC-type phosphate transport system substrate-binding protein